MCKNLAKSPDPDLDRHQNGKSDPDGHQYDEELLICGPYLEGERLLNMSGGPPL